MDLSWPTPNIYIYIYIYIHTHTNVNFSASLILCNNFSFYVFYGWKIIWVWIDIKVIKWFYFQVHCGIQINRKCKNHINFIFLLIRSDRNMELVHGPLTRSCIQPNPKSWPAPEQRHKMMRRRGGSYIPALMQEENRLQPLTSCAASWLQSAGLRDSITA